jgi:hypothetical protein
MQYCAYYTKSFIKYYNNKTHIPKQESETERERDFDKILKNKKHKGVQVLFM